MSIFSMVLESEMSWGVGRALDVLTGCRRFVQRDRRRIGNVQFNELRCSNCHRHLNQFTNGCDFTFNRSTREIGQACLWTPGVDFGWLTGKNQHLGFLAKLFGERDKNKVLKCLTRLKLPFAPRIVGMAGRHLVTTVELKRYRTDEVVIRHDVVVVPTEADFMTREAFASIHRNDLSAVRAREILSYDITIASTYREVIAQQRRLITPFP